MKATGLIAGALLPGSLRNRAPRPRHRRHPASPRPRTPDAIVWPPADATSRPRPAPGPYLMPGRPATSSIPAPPGPPRLVPPYIAVPQAPPEPARAPRQRPRAVTPAPVALDWLARLSYPAYRASPERYAATMRLVSTMTGTSSLLEYPAAWHRHGIEGLARGPR